MLNLRFRLKDTYTMSPWCVYCITYNVTSYLPYSILYVVFFINIFFWDFFHIHTTQYLFSGVMFFFFVYLFFRCYIFKQIITQRLSFFTDYFFRDYSDLYLNLYKLSFTHVFCRDNFFCSVIYKFVYMHWSG